MTDSPTVDVTTTGGGNVVKHWQLRIDGEFVADTSAPERGAWMEDVARRLNEASGYEDILRRYIAHVGDCEGVTFISDVNGWMSDVRFTADEVAVLQRLEADIDPVTGRTEIHPTLDDDGVEVVEEQIVFYDDAGKVVHDTGRQPTGTPTTVPPASTWHKHRSYFRGIWSDWSAPALQPRPPFGRRVTG